MIFLHKLASVCHILLVINLELNFKGCVVERHKSTWKILIFFLVNEEVFGLAIGLASLDCPDFLFLALLVTAENIALVASHSSSR